MIKFSREKVLLLHQMLAEATGGSFGVRDEALLDSALENAFSGFGDQEFYPSKEEKGARLGYSLISNHAFVDGNKRIAATLFIYFLQTYHILYKEDKQIIDNNTLTALTLLIAESNPKEKNIIIDLVMNFLV